MPILVIAQLSFREAIRRRIAQAALALGLAFVILFAVAFYFITTAALPFGSEVTDNLARTQGYNFMVMAGMYAVNFLALAMGALLAADTLAGEIGSGSIQAIVTKPIRRADVVLGKWLGFGLLLGIYLVLMAGGVMAAAYLLSGYTLQNAWSGVLLIYLTCLLVMTVTLAASSIFSGLATGGIVFGLYGVSFIGGWVEQIGAVLKNDTAINVGIIASLIIPSDALWRRAAYEMTSVLLRSFGISAGPFAVLSVPSPAMVVYAGIYLLIALAIALRRFNSRDL
jgi:ABC-type transport system involved in multi-copper enzyme maturation permease subunit